MLRTTGGCVTIQTARWTDRRPCSDWWRCRGRDLAPRENHRPRQGGPLGEGSIEKGLLHLASQPGLDCVRQDAQLL